MTRTEAGAVAVNNLSFSYANTKALDGVSFEVGQAEIFGVLGPNGGGKTTLFRILSTLLPSPINSVSIFGADPAVDVAKVRASLGVVFQSPSLDGKLTVRENLVHHGHLYGLRGRDLNDRIETRLSALGMLPRASDIVETLSGGLKRRVELAKGLLSEPKILILDEPSTGLDPRARREFWRELESLRQQKSTTILVTTHLTEEAERCDRLAFLDQGRLVSIGRPDELKQRIGGDVINIRSSDPSTLRKLLVEKIEEDVELIDGGVRLQKRDGHTFVKLLYDEYTTYIDSITIGRPTLEDVFIAETGRSLGEDGEIL